MKDILENVIRTIDYNDLIKERDSILVALSGGPDSVALLHLLNNIREKYHIKLSAAHLDHGIRKSSHKDREFCRELCKKLKIKFYSKKINVPVLAKKFGDSVEMAGRNARYEYFEELSELYKFTKIATGHTFDDNVETILLNIIRGTGMSGLTGIPIRRGIIVRPLIEISKKDLLKWLRDNEIPFITDATNLSMDYSRNRIRHKVIPELERLNPSVRESITRLSKNILEDVEIIGQLVSSAYQKVVVKSYKSKIVLDLGKLKTYHQSLVKKVVGEAFRRLNSNQGGPSSNAYSRIFSLIKSRSGAKLFLGGGVWIEKSQNKISIFFPSNVKAKLKLKIPGMTLIPENDLCMDTAIIEREKIKRLWTTSDIALLDKDRMKNISMRYWENGDKIRPLGMTGHRLLSDIFIDKKIPEFDRGNIPLVISGSKIAWIAGLMISDDFKVTSKTKNIMKIRLCAQ